MKAVDGRIEQALSRWWLRLLIVLVGAFVAFGPILQSQFVSDDFNLIYSVSSKGPFGHFTLPPTDYFRPLISLSMWIDFKLYGLNPLGYHITNLLVHSANAFLVGSLATILYRRVRPHRSATFGIVIGLVYAILPSHYEPVAWIAGRSDLWMTLFALISIRAFLRWFESGKGLVMAILFAALALCSKETALPIVLIVPLLGWIIAADDRKKKILVAFGSLAALAIVYVAVRSSVVGDAVGAGANKGLLTGAGPARIGMNLFVFYVRCFFPGIPPHWFGPVSGDEAFTMLKQWVPAHKGLLAAILLPIAALKVWMLTRFAKVSHESPDARRIVLWCLVAFALSCALALPLFVSLIGTQNERYIYLPSVFALIGAGMFAAEALVGRVYLAAAAIAVFAAVYLGCDVSIAGYWNRAASFADQVYTGLKAVGKEVDQKAPGQILIYNAPTSLQGYPVAGNCLASAWKVLVPEHKDTDVRWLSQQDWGSPSDEVEFSRDACVLMEAGVFLHAGVEPAEGAATLDYQLHLSIPEKNHLLIEGTPPAEAKLFVISANGLFAHVNTERHP